MIYETHGRAREYFELAANLYTGCENNCRYCYGADVLHMKPEQFFRRARPKENAVANLKRDAARLANKGERRHILLSFITDPYQAAEGEYQITRKAIRALHDYGLYVAILTKCGARAMRDFDQLSHLDLFGVSLTCWKRETVLRWEPNAPLPWERIHALKRAREHGIPTWVSCEPVLDPDETLTLIRESSDYVDHYKVGKLNYHEEAKKIDWQKFANDAVALLLRLGKSFYIKKDLARFIGKPEGITKGNIPK